MDSPLVGVIPGDVYVAQPGSGPNDLIASSWWPSSAPRTMPSV